MNKIKIPNYTICEEIINSVSHGVGAIMSIFGLIILILKTDNSISLFACLIYGLSLFILYLVSCIYHAIPPYNNLKKVLRVIDHCNVFLFEAGTFSPICLLLIGGIEGYIYFIIIWIITVIGIILNCINVDKYQIFSLFLHVVIGWSVILLLKNIFNSLNSTCITLLIVGGLLYSIGAILYKIGATKKYMHSIFHFFCLGGSTLHYLFILFFVI